MPASSMMTKRPRVARRTTLQQRPLTRSAHVREVADTAPLDHALQPIRRELEAVSDRLLAELAEPVARRVVYLVSAGGKRLRPALVLLAGASGPSSNRTALIDTATAVELIHTATLIHDDIIDQSPLRRSQPTFHQRWGTERAVLMGDYLYATAFRLLSRVPTAEVMRVIADVCQDLCRGELHEVEARYRLDLTEDEYLAIIRDKTASLIGGCCHTGALLGGCSTETTAGLTKFGVNMGLAFQIIDDCLDLSGETARLGKATLTDLDKGILSLPIVYTIRALSRTDREKLFAPLAKRRTDARFLTRVAHAAQQTGAIAAAKQRADGLMREALQALKALSMNGLAATYEALAAYTVSRQT